jgi:hypothetical protein
MESELSADQGALRDIDSIRDRLAGMPRGHAMLQLIYTVLLAAYMGLLVLSGSSEGGASILGGTTMALVLPPVIISTGLISGANERFSIRQRATARQWAAIGFFIAALGVILVWGVVAGGYPWWWSIVYATITLVIFAARPLSVLRRAPKTEDSAGEPTRLSRPVFVVTILIGVFLGALCAVALAPIASSVVMLVGLLVTIVALTAQRSSWGLLRTGYEWRAAQWAGFGVAATLMFAVAVLLMTTDLVTPLFAVCSGVVITTCATISAFVRGRGHGASSA